MTISAWTEPGCINPDNDPNAKALGDDFKNGLSGWCRTKKAGAVFCWLAFGLWIDFFLWFDNLMMIFVQVSGWLHSF